MARYMLRFTTAAVADLEDIFAYTLQVWGENQAARYVRHLHRTLGQLKTGHTPLSRPHKTAVSGEVYSIYHGENHIIFYRLRKNIAEVIRICHQRSDWGMIFQPVQRKKTP